MGTLLLWKHSQTRTLCRDWSGLNSEHFVYHKRSVGFLRRDCLPRQESPYLFSRHRVVVLMCHTTLLPHQGALASVPNFNISIQFYKNHLYTEICHLRLIFMKSELADSLPPLGRALGTRVLIAWLKKDGKKMAMMTPTEVELIYFSLSEHY